MFQQNPCGIEARVVVQKCDKQGSFSRTVVGLKRRGDTGVARRHDCFSGSHAGLKQRGYPGVSGRRPRFRRTILGLVLIHLLTAREPRRERRGGCHCGKSQFWTGHTTATCETPTVGHTTLSSEALTVTTPRLQVKQRPSDTPLFQVKPLPRPLRTFT